MQRQKERGLNGLWEQPVDLITISALRDLRFTMGPNGVNSITFV